MFGAKKKKESHTGNKSKNVGYIFVVERDGFAYYKDKRLNLVCKHATLCSSSPYAGYMWKYDYLANLDWFKRYVMLMLVNKGQVKFVGMTKDEFFSLGDDTIDVTDIEEIKIKK